MKKYNHMNIQKCATVCAAILLGWMTPSSVKAASIVTNDVTAVLWPSGAPFTFFDSASIGGGDTAAAGSINFDRNLGTLNIGVNGSEVSVRGLGWASGGASAFGASSVIATITYLGADGIVSIGDDVLVGKATNNVVANVGASEWVWVFDSPITQVVDGASNRFRINLSAVTGTMRFKTTTGSAAADAKVSVAGSSVPYALPTTSDRVWRGNLSSVWDTSALNWTNLLGGGAQSYANGNQAMFDDSLAPGTLNTNITLSAAHAPSSVAVNNSSYDYSFSGGSLSGAMTLTKYGSRALTLNSANDFSGLSTLGAGIVRLGNANGLGTGQINFNNGGLSSDGATARTVTNSIQFSGAAILGNAVNNGALTFTGPVNFAGGGRDIAVNSPVTFSGSITNGGLDEKTGSATLTFDGVTGEQGVGAWQIEGGNFVISGGNIARNGAIRIGNTSANGLSRMVITNGAVVTVLGAGQNARVGNDQAPVAAATSTNILDIAGTLTWATDSGGLMVLGSAGQFAQLNLHPGSLLKISRFFPGTKTNELNLNGTTLSATVNTTIYMVGLTNAFIRAGGVTFDTAGFDLGVGQPLLDGGGGGGLTKTGAGTLTLLSTNNTYTGATVVNDGTLGVTLPATLSALRVANGRAVSFNVNDSAGTANTSVTNSTINFNFGNAGVVPSPIITSANINVSGANVINITGAGLPLGAITLIQHGGKIGGGTFTLGSLPLGLVATLTDGPTVLVLNVTSSVKALLWTATTDNEWATNGVLNWNFGADAYQEYPLSGFGDQVTFNNDALFNYSVTITNDVKPAGVIANITTGNVDLTGVGQIAGATGLTKSGAAKLTLKSANSYSGITTVTAGTLVATAPGALGSTSGGTTASGTGTVQLGDGLSTGVTITGETITITGAGVDAVRGALRGAADLGPNVWAGPIVLGGTLARIGTEDNGSLTVAGNITDNGNNYGLLYRPGTGGTVNITTSGHSYAFTRTFAGTVRLGINNALSTNLLEVGSGTIDLNGFNQTVGGLADSSGPGTILNNGGGLSTLTINTGTNDFSSAALIQDGAAAINLVKTGNTRQLLTGAHSYTGTTTVNGGELRINNTLASSAVTVASGGTLRGVGGTIAGPISVSSGGTFAAGGFDLGTLTNNNTLTFNAGSFCLAHLRGNTTNGDLAVVTTVAYAGTLQVTNISATPIQVGQVYTIFAAGSFSGNFVNAANVAIQGGGTASFNPATGQLTILTGPSAPTLNVVNNGTSLDFSWTGSFKLQAQTNSINVGVANNWGDYPGGGSSPVNVPVDAAQATVFFRLINQ